jgi:hypothetical protein
LLLITVLSAALAGTELAAGVAGIADSDELAFLLLHSLL